MDAIKQHIIVVCGIKNSGKTTLIRKIIPKLAEAGLKVATIKHDGHDFESDVPGTDSYYHQKAGAYGTAVFSKNRFMITKQITKITEKDLIGFFSEADLIIIEGMKDSTYDKIEVIRSANGNQPASNPQRRFLIVTDRNDRISAEPQVHLDDIDKIVERILTVIGKGEPVK